MVNFYPPVYAVPTNAIILMSPAEKHNHKVETSEDLYTDE